MPLWVPAQLMLTLCCNCPLVTITQISWPNHWVKSGHSVQAAHQTLPPRNLDSKTIGYLWWPRTESSHRGSALSTQCEGKQRNLGKKNKVNIMTIDSAAGETKRQKGQMPTASTVSTSCQSQVPASMRPGLCVLPALGHHGIHLIPLKDKHTLCFFQQVSYNQTVPDEEKIVSMKNRNFKQKIISYLKPMLANSLIYWPQTYSIYLKCFSNLFTQLHK